MAKTFATQLETTTISNCELITPDPSNRNLLCPTYPGELSQSDYIHKVRTSFPPLPQTSRPSSPSGPADSDFGHSYVRTERLHDADIFEDGETSKSTLAALDCTHWLEVMDKRHRYGSYLRPYYDVWVSIGAPGSFFSWLDYGEGRYLDLSNLETLARKKRVSREYLEKCEVEYCSEGERERYRVVLNNNLLVWASDDAPDGRRKLSTVETGREEKWIFVIDVGGNLFINRKRKGVFHHSSFVAGAPVRAAGRITVQKGVAVCIGPNSGHYRTTWEQLLMAVHNFFGSSLCVVPPLPCTTHEAHCIGVAI